MCKGWKDMEIQKIAEGKIEGKILAYYDTGMELSDIAAKSEQTVDFVKDTLRENGLL